MLLNVFPLGLILDFRELSSELIELKFGLESSFKLDNSFIDPTQSSSSLLFTILSLISSFKFVKEDSDCESIATELKLKSSKSVALTVENVKNTQSTASIILILFACFLKKVLTTVVCLYKVLINRFANPKNKHS